MRCIYFPQSECGGNNNSRGRERALRGASKKYMPRIAICGAVLSSSACYPAAFVSEVRLDHFRPFQPPHRLFSAYMPSVPDAALPFSSDENSRPEAGSGNVPPQPPTVTPAQSADVRKKIRRLFSRAKSLTRHSQYDEAILLLRQILELDPADGHSYLALARIYSRRSLAGGIGSEGYSDEARRIFGQGLEACGENIHLLQAWAVHEAANPSIAREFFDRAMLVDRSNPYVCHAYGLMEMRGGNIERARSLWYAGLSRQPTSALACSLGHLEFAHRRSAEDARHVYAYCLDRVGSERERGEVLLAWATLEERRGDVQRARHLIKMVLKRSPGDGRAHVALARLEGRLNRAKGGKGGTGRRGGVVRKVLAEASKTVDPTLVGDGRIFNVWATLEAKEGNFDKARKILAEAVESFPNDHTILQAAGKVEEMSGKTVKAEEFYRRSVRLQPSAHSLLSLAMIEIKKAKRGNSSNFHIKRAKDLFEEAILVDPRHGAVYNAYGTMELGRGCNNAARDVFVRAVRANCTDAASVYHGLAKVELSSGDVERARGALQEGLVRTAGMGHGTFDGSIASARDDRRAFLAHALGTLELNAGRASVARDVFREGLEAHGNSSWMLLGAALCERRLGKEVAARALFERSVYADRKHGHAWQAWGVMEERAGNFRAAKTLFEGGIKYCPRHGALWQAYATMESRLGNFDVARNLFAAGIKKCPKHVPLYQAWACLELRGGYLAAAKMLISAALSRDSSQGATWRVAAKIEGKQENSKGTEAMLRKGLENDPNHAQLYCDLADHLVTFGKYSEARLLLETGLEIDPLHAPLYHSLAEVEAMVFNLEGLSILNKRASAVFNSNALVPPIDSSNAWGNKIKMRKIMSGNKNLPSKVAALATDLDLRIDEGSSVTVGGEEPDFSAMLEGMKGDYEDVFDIFVPEGTAGNEDVEEVVVKDDLINF
eukprot:CAMPEP_0194320808 /NCGR_PEP_ID=MMETSP0171-20130528/17087_1 /TAXON_ID=218684 /ORGANISM="Corethron pennatum, Strain L29A3" /LENGTH=947 /DNA_ID=CAMNT_0039078473 /DNA_START=67 /DNA_END=2910 /DNA_ORIENTATION=+